VLVIRHKRVMLLALQGGTHDVPPEDRPPVRGTTCKPNLSKSSWAIRSSLHVRLSQALWRISACRSAGSGGRPGFDFLCQNRRNPWRYQSRGSDAKHQQCATNCTR
jgi:hypothetical protein